MLAQKLIIVAITFISMGVVLLIISSLISIQSQQQDKSKIKTEVAVGGFIGFIPFGFFTSRRAFWMWLAIIIVAIVIWIIARKLL